MRETTLAASIVADMVQYFERHGLDPAVALGEAGITIALPPQPDERVPGSQVARLWEYAVRELRDPCAGLHMAEAYSPGTLDILGYVVLSCQTVVDVLDRLGRYVRVLNDGLRIDITVDGRVAHVRATFVESMDNYLLQRPREGMDSLWGGLARELGRLTAHPIRAAEVRFAHAAPPRAELADYQRIFGCPVRFGAAENRFTLATEHLAKPILSANPALLQVFSKHADDVIARLDTYHGASQRVMTVVAKRMKGAVPTLGEVAKELAMSNRNLQRTLRADGTSYQKLVDSLRRDLAISHLQNPENSAGQVGFLLGFSEPSAFHRAFRRWTGKAPNEFRQATS